MTEVWESKADYDRFMQEQMFPKMPPNGPVPKIQEWKQDATFFVVSGALTTTRGGETSLLWPGTLVTVSPETPLTFANWASSRW